MFHVKINEEKCRVCGQCAKNCPTRTIKLAESGKYRIEQAGCIKCGACIDICPFSSVGTVNEVSEDD